MKLYHYSTWEGFKIAKARVLKPQDKYHDWRDTTLINAWPSLTFLTEDDYWDPSVQAHSPDHHWEKCGSYPETYYALGIPCWRFEVNTNGIITGSFKDFMPGAAWQLMVEDAAKLGSDPYKWHITSQDAPVIEACKWEDDGWCIKRTG